MFNKNFCDSLFASLDKTNLFEKRKEFAPGGANIFILELTLVGKGAKSETCGVVFPLRAPLCAKN